MATAKAMLREFFQVARGKGQVHGLILHRRHHVNHFHVRR